MSISVKDFVKQNILKEHFTVNVNPQGYGEYSKEIKVISLNKPLNGHNIAVYCVVLYANTFSDCGVLLSVGEFKEISNVIQNVTDYSKLVKKKHFSKNKREWQVNTFSDQIWFISLRDKNGLKSTITFDIGESKLLIEYKDFIIKRCYQLENIHRFNNNETKFHVALFESHLHKSFETNPKFITLNEKNDCNALYVELLFDYEVPSLVPLSFFKIKTVMLTLEEFECFANVAINITTYTPKVKKRILSEQCREWQLYYEITEGKWCISIQEEGGHFFGSMFFTLEELNIIGNAKNFIIKRWLDLNAKKRVLH